MEERNITPVFVAVTSRFSLSLLSLEKLSIPIIVVNNIEAEEVYAFLAILQARRKDVNVLNVGHCSYSKGLCRAMRYAEDLGFTHVVTVDRLDDSLSETIDKLVTESIRNPEKFIQASPYDSRKVWPLKRVLPFLKKYSETVGFELFYSLVNEKEALRITFGTPFRQLQWDEIVVGKIRSTISYSQMK